MRKDFKAGDTIRRDCNELSDKLIIQCDRAHYLVLDMGVVSITGSPAPKLYIFTSEYVQDVYVKV